MGGGFGLYIHNYHRSSRDLVNGFFLSLPVFFFYEGGVLLLPLDERNAADLIFRNILERIGFHSLMVFNTILLFFFLVAGLVVIKRKVSLFPIYPLLVVESAMYALALCPLVFFMEGQFIPLLAQETSGCPDILSGLIFSLGAGLYEEIFFRLILTGCFYLFLKRVLTLPGILAASLSLLISAVLFSLFHHLGSGSSPFNAVFFLYRFFAGIFLSAIFIFRGFAAAVYTHALYDVFIHLQVT